MSTFVSEIFEILPMSVVKNYVKQFRVRALDQHSWYCFKIKNLWKCASSAINGQNFLKRKQNVKRTNNVYVRYTTAIKFKDRILWQIQALWLFHSWEFFDNDWKFQKNIILTSTDSRGKYTIQYVLFSMAI